MFQTMTSDKHASCPGRKKQRNGLGVIPSLCYVSFHDGGVNERTFSWPLPFLSWLPTVPETFTS